MQQKLNVEFTKEEVQKVMKQMHPNKASDPDRMTPIFYQTNCYILTQEVTDVVLTAFHTGTLPTPLNHTHITFIPKTKSP